MSSTTHLTRGPIGPQLLSLALPLLAGNVLQQFYNAIDAVVVGRAAGESAFAAVGISGAVMDLFLFLISGGCAGAGVLLTQFYGAQDLKTFRREFFLTALFGGLLSLALAGGGLLLLPPLLSALRTPAPLWPWAAAYLRVIFLGFPAAFAFHLGAAVLRSVGNTRAALWFLMLSMGVNLVLDLTFVAGLHLGTAGAAIATVLAQALAAGLCLLYLARRFPVLMFHREDMTLDLPLLRRTAWFSAVSALHMASLYIGKLLVQRTVNTLGEASISAFTAASRVEGFANSFGSSGCTAVSLFIGQNTGAGESERIRQGFRTSLLQLGLFGLSISLTMILFAQPCLALVLPAEGAAGMPPALGYLRLVACFYLFNFLGSGLSGYFQGRGKVSIPVLGTTCHITLRVILSALLAPKLGLPAVALACGLGWIAVVTLWGILARPDLNTLRSCGKSATLSPAC